MLAEADVAPIFPRMMRVSEAARLLHVHPNTLRKWSSKGVIRSYRLGRRGDRRFSVDDLRAFLQASSVILEAPSALEARNHR